MSLGLAVLAAVLVGLVLGGRVQTLAAIRLRRVWLFYLAIGLQIVAFPFGFLPWATGDAAATALWLLSYGLLIVAAIQNRHVTGVPVVALGMAANLAAIVANGGHMPVLPGAMAGAGDAYAVHMNSEALADPTLSWLVDRWAAPSWVPLANVYSIGDVGVAAGAFVLVLAAMGVRLPRPRRAPQAASS